MTPSRIYNCECGKQIELSPAEVYIFERDHWYGEYVREKKEKKVGSNWCEKCQKTFRGSVLFHNSKCGLNV